jgi:hypothetical protein
VLCTASFLALSQALLWFLFFHFSGCFCTGKFFCPLEWGEDIGRFHLGENKYKKEKEKKEENLNEREKKER